MAASRRKQDDQGIGDGVAEEAEAGVAKFMADEIGAVLGKAFGGGIFGEALGGGFHAGEDGGGVLFAGIHKKRRGVHLAGGVS